jgi:ribosomal protein S18 acetylase RimI-like enzyme
MNEIRAVIRSILFERFGFNNNKTFNVPMDVKSTAQKAISTAGQTSNGGNEGSGKRKAQELSQGTPHSHAQMKRLKAFFDANQPGSPEWELHGGDAAKRWVDSALSVTHDDNMRTKDNMRKIGGGGYGMNDGMGSMSATMMKTNNTRNHSVWTRAKNRMQEATKPNRSRTVLFQDEHGKHIVYDDGSYRIAVDDPNSAQYITLWKQVKEDNWKRVGYLDAWRSKMNFKGRDGDYLSIRSIEIESESKGKGYGRKMYQALIDFSSPEIAGIYSYLPNRVNKKEIPKIYKRYDSKEDGDYQFIDFNEIQLNESVIDKDGNLIGFMFDDEEGEEFHWQWDIWLNEQEGAVVDGFILTSDGMSLEWVFQENDDYIIDADIFPYPDYKSEMTMTLFKNGQPHYKNIVPVDRELMFDNGPDRVWETYQKNLFDFIQEAGRQGKFLDL